MLQPFHPSVIEELSGGLDIVVGLSDPPQTPQYAGALQ